MADSKQPNPPVKEKEVVKIEIDTPKDPPAPAEPLSPEVIEKRLGPTVLGGILVLIGIGVIAIDILGILLLTDFSNAGKIWLGILGIVLIVVGVLLERVARRQE